VFGSGPATGSGPGDHFLTAECHPGDVVLGGGYRIDPTSSYFDVYLLQTGPTNTNLDPGPPEVLTQAYFIYVVNKETDPGHKIFIQVTAICGEVAA
jgi:hypothetical protein